MHRIIVKHVCTYTAVESECPTEAKRAVTESVRSSEDVCQSSSEVHTTTSAPCHSSSVQPSLARIQLPLLSGSVETQYKAQRAEEATMLLWNCDKLKCDEPLQLRLPGLSKQRTFIDCNHSSPVELTDSSKQTCMISKNNAFTALIAAYESSDTEDQWSYYVIAECKCLNSYGHSFIRWPLVE